MYIILHGEYDDKPRNVNFDLVAHFSPHPSEGHKGTRIYLAPDHISFDVREDFELICARLGTCYV